ncbi:MAG: YybH family protein [Acidobacteriota bacterium]
MSAPDHRMGRIGLAVFLVLAPRLAWAADPAPPAAEASALAATLNAALQASADGWNRGDLDAFIGVYAPQATFMGQDGPIGVAAMREHFRQKYFSGGHPAQRLHFEHVTVRPLGESDALLTARWVLTGGGQPERSGWTSLWWERTAAGWRIVHDHSS